MDIWRDDDIIWFADASQGGEKPLQCNIGFYNGAPFSWKVNNFKWTTLSACEAEWFSQTNAAATLQALQPIMVFMGISLEIFPITFFCDNEVACRISQGDYTTKRMKHVLTRMGYLKELVEAKLITLVHIGTDGMIADIGTKILSPSVFHRFLVWLVS